MVFTQSDYLLLHLLGSAAVGIPTPKQHSEASKPPFPLAASRLIALSWPHSLCDVSLSATHPPRESCTSRSSSAKLPAP
ncbi:hypothetical protein EV426DRAFT_587623 [Tirmania nivea]|nr:hypothetical protein EV426DRAFT_587623 [Tirmania nivea]